MKIRVNERDIEGATPYTIHNCVVARALRRITRQPWCVAIRLCNLGKEVRVIPEEVALKIEAFNAGEKIVPFEFDFNDFHLMEAPDVYNK